MIIFAKSNRVFIHIYCPSKYFYNLRKLGMVLISLFKKSYGNFPLTRTLRAIGNLLQINSMTESGKFARVMAIACKGKTNHFGFVDLDGNLKHNLSKSVDLWFNSWPEFSQGTFCW